MAGPTRARREAGETARMLGHHLSPFIHDGNKTRAHCLNVVCNASVLLDGSEAVGFALTHICPFLEQEITNGHA